MSGPVRTGTRPRGSCWGSLMDLSFVAVFGDLIANPLLLAVLVLVLAVIIVNGATDAANAIATVVGTRCMPPGAAIVMAAVCNFFGLLIMTLVSTAVADTISHMVNFGGDAHEALVALCAAMIAIVVWGVTAWYFGIPTSQSHSLIAGLTGAAIAIEGFTAGVNWWEWMKVLYGLVISTVLGFALGWLIARCFSRLFARVSRPASERFFTGAQICSAAFLAFMHGAQDGQKFMSIAMMAIMLELGVTGQPAEYPLWIMLMCSLTMAVGTGMGGKRIIKSVAMQMTKLEKYQGFSASLAAALSILLATLTGLPVSTTHTSTTAIMGVGAEKRFSSVKWSTAKDMAMTWVATFPGCGLLGFVLAKLFMMLL